MTADTFTRWAGIIAVVVLMVLLLMSALGSWVNERCPRDEMPPAWWDQCVDELADKVLS